MPTGTVVTGLEAEDGAKGPLGGGERRSLQPIKDSGPRSTATALIPATSLSLRASSTSSCRKRRRSAGMLASSVREGT
jgi:hypothetical protein